MRIARHAPSRFRILGAAVLAALLAAPAAHGVERTQLGMHVYDIKVELIDLDPLDGIAPSITWGAPSRRASISLWDGPHGQGGTVEGAGELALSSAHIATSMHVGPDSWRMAVSGDPAAGFQSSGHALASASIDFVLAPHTAMFISAVADIEVENHMPDAYLRRSLSLSGSVYKRVGGAETWSRMEDGRSYTTPVSERYRLGGVLTAGESASQGNLTFSAATSFTFKHQTSPVPEPGTYAMLLAGLGILAGVRQRRAGARRRGLPGR